MAELVYPSRLHIVFPKILKTLHYSTTSGGYFLHHDSTCSSSQVRFVCGLCSGHKNNCAERVSLIGNWVDHTT